MLSVLLRRCKVCMSSVSAVHHYCFLLPSNVNSPVYGKCCGLSYRPIARGVRGVLKNRPLGKKVHNFSKKVHYFSKKVHNFSIQVQIFSSKSPLVTVY